VPNPIIDPAHNPVSIPKTPSNLPRLYSGLGSKKFNESDFSPGIPAFIESEEINSNRTMK